MPIISVRFARGRTVEQKRSLAEAVTQAVVSSLDVQPEWVTVLIEEYERENSATGGMLHIDKFGSGFGQEGTSGGGDND